MSLKRTIANRQQRMKEEEKKIRKGHQEVRFLRLAFFFFTLCIKVIQGTKKTIRSFFWLWMDACMHTWATFLSSFLFPNKWSKQTRKISSINCFRTREADARRRCMRSKMGHNVWVRRSTTRQNTKHKAQRSKEDAKVCFLLVCLGTIVCKRKDNTQASDHIHSMDGGSQQRCDLFVF